MAAYQPYNPMNDVLFKFIFGSEERKQITIDFINSVLDRDEERRIADIEFKNVEFIPLHENDKLTRLDVFCVSNAGERLDLEVQVVNHLNMASRSLYYWSQMYLMSLRKGQKYRELKPSITINILRYSFLPQEEPHSMYGIYNPKTMHRLTDNMELHFLEIPKFKGKPIASMTKIEKWLAYFANKLDEQEREALAMSEAAIRNAMDAADIFMQSEEQRLAYINREMAIMDYNSDMEGCREKGREQGLEQGRKQGREQGRIEIALEMLKDKMDLDKIVRYSRLPMDKILSLGKQHKLL